MTLVRFLIVAAVLALAGCQTYPPLTDDVEVTRIVVEKSSRRLYLMSGDKRVAMFPIHLGFAPEGDKVVSGDGKTPEGEYYIDRRNPNSAFHLSLGISYPNSTDVAAAKALGAHPGGDIFIHGLPNGYSEVSTDWTQGCIAVSNDAIEVIYRVVRTGTPITINP